ncbi:Serrate RNA effector molecule-like protein [Drosera capensis]
MAETLTSPPPSSSPHRPTPLPPPPPPSSSPSSPHRHSSSSPPPRRRDRDRDSRDRRDTTYNNNDSDADRDRDRDWPPNRRNRSREREREYKRRLSPSPPPPSYRERRGQSPENSRRYSPPPWKRYRREDGFDGRRSPGYGERRFGYDRGSGYDRNMGGRPGYGDDRPHGRYMGRSGGNDWDSARGGFNDSSNGGKSQREGLMTYKQFIQELEDDVLPSEAERRYQEYKSEYISTQKRTYFEAHKDEEWLKNKYHPTNLIPVIERRNEHARKVAKDFLFDLHSGSLNIGPGVDSSSANKSGQTSEPNSEDDADVGARRRHHGRPVAKDIDPSAAPKAHPISSEPKRIQADIELAQALVRKLDAEKAIEDNILSRADNEKINRDKSYNGTIGPVVIVQGLTSVKGVEGVELLDTLVTYLWRVHGVDYYGFTEVAEAEGLRHVRAEGKNSDASGDGIQWEKKLEAHWQERLKNQDPLETMCAKDKLEAATIEVLDPYVRKIRDEKYGWKYGCGAKGCTKLFHAAEYVHKHLKLKHPDLVTELTAKLREDLYFENYMNDPDAPGGQLVMQQPIVKDKWQRSRPPSEGQFRDDRESHWERPKRDRRGIGENDGPNKRNYEEPMFDAFGEQGTSGPFAPDIPPPVLMPVPGAGPLGPFVPAPPEVAMRMLREQGGPPPLEGAGRNGITGLPGLPGLGGAPIILPPSIRQDPRRIRSYQDLDAMEDEVTVIDYRSL